MTCVSVRRLPKDPGPAAWNAILAPAPPPRVLDADITADWLVIGAGFAGLSAARRLGQLRGGDRIVVLDAVRVGEGPAGRNSGFMIDLPHDLASEDYSGGLEADRTQIALNRLAIGFAVDAVAEYAMPDEAARPVGKINAAATEKGDAHNRAYAQHLERLGEPFALLDADAICRITGTRYYVGGLSTPGTLMLQPALYVRGLAEGLARTGAAEIYENAPVVALAREGHAWRAQTPRGSVSAANVILCVNGHAESFGFFSGRLMHVFTYSSMTRPLTADEVARLGGEAMWSATPADPMGTTVRRISGTGGDRIVVRNRFTFDPAMEISDARLDAVAQEHERAFRVRFPMLDAVTMDYRWAGRLCLARNGATAFGEVAPGLFSACCQNGLGTAKGTLHGMMAANLAARANAPELAALVNAEGPSRLPPAPIAWLGANALLRWKEWQAGREK